MSSTQTAADKAHEFVPDYAHDPSSCGYEFTNRNFCGESRSAAIHRLDSDAHMPRMVCIASTDPSEVGRVIGGNSEPQAVLPERIWIAPHLNVFSLRSDEKWQVEYVLVSTASTLAEALRTLTNAYFRFGEAAVEHTRLSNEPIIPQELRPQYEALVDAALAARTALARWEKGES